MSRLSYDSVVGSLMYVIVCTRPDLAHAISIVSRFMGQLGKNIGTLLRGFDDQIDTNLKLHELKAQFASFLSFY